MRNNVKREQNVRPSCPTPEVQLFDAGPDFPAIGKSIPEAITVRVILSRFYPLAGRASAEGEFIDCNDAGIPFTVARFRGHDLSVLLESPRPGLCRRDDTSQLFRLRRVYDGWRFVAQAVRWDYHVFRCSVVGCGGAWGAKEAVFPNYIAQYMFPQKERMPAQLGSHYDIAKIGKSSEEASTPNDGPPAEESEASIPNDGPPIEESEAGELLTEECVAGDETFQTTEEETPAVELPATSGRPRRQPKPIVRYGDFVSR
ncbi:hypothetical protein SASPL_131025 [Salvia splendens]|uniref:Uncharacterized protein n=1 Tax=Salvia splendens TaxID=180675 RepID=A0A8X8X743_SALSN|nr:hypothetical protein SASPL_131025 [Salvia splendens]